MASSVANILAGAKKTLAHAEKAFPSSLAESAGATPAREYSNASYRMARHPEPAKPKTGLAGEAESAAQGIKSRQEMTAKALL